jgi:hypothetical protein
LSSSRSFIRAIIDVTVRHDMIAARTSELPGAPRQNFEYLLAHVDGTTDAVSAL